MDRLTLQSTLAAAEQGVVVQETFSETAAFDFKKHTVKKCHSTCSLSSESWPESRATRVTVLSSFSCRDLISFCSLSPSLLTRDMALMRGNHSKFFSWRRERGRKEKLDVRHKRNEKAGIKLV